MIQIVSMFWLSSQHLVYDLLMPELPASLDFERSSLKTGCLFIIFIGIYLRFSFIPAPLLMLHHGFGSRSAYSKIRVAAISHPVCDICPISASPRARCAHTALRSLSRRRSMHSLYLHHLSIRLHPVQMSLSPSLSFPFCCLLLCFHWRL